MSSQPDDEFPATAPQSFVMVIDRVLGLLLPFILSQHLCGALMYVLARSIDMSHLWIRPGIT